MKKADLKKRYNLIDALRGFALINMTAYHFLFDVFMVYGVNTGWAAHPLVIAWERFICISFILISGVSLHFSNHAYRRGIIINLCGFLITAVTFFAMPSQTVWFGVLNLIGCSMIICNALRPFFDRINPYLGAGVSLLLFAVFYGVPERYIGFFNIKLFDLPGFLYQFRYAAFIGFPDSGFRSSDYFPVITWIFVYILGYFLWRIIKQYGKENIFRQRVYFLDFLGRHSLIIYLLHQPVLIGICYLIFGYI